MERAIAPTGSGATTATSLPVAGRALWWKADSLGNLTEGAPVSSWKSDTGTGIASQSDPSSMPRLFSAGPEGLPIVRFDGIKSALPTDVVGPGGTGLTTFLVAKAPTEGAYQSAIRYQDASGYVLYPWALFGPPAKAGVSNDGGVDAGLFTGLTAKEWNIGEMAWGSGGTFSTWRNGQLIGQRAANTSVLPSASLTLGSASNEMFSGDMAEVLIYNRVLSDTERQTVEAYLSNKYGLRVAGSVVPSTWTTVVPSLDGEALYEDQGLSPDTVYWYRVVTQGGATTLTSDPVIAATRSLPPAAPDAPGEPASGAATGSSVAVTAPGPNLPARADALLLQVKLPTQADTDYADVGNRLDAGQVRIAPSLVPETTYRFRFVAVGAGGRTPSALFADYSTTALAPETPGAVQLSNLSYNGGDYSLKVTMPPLPARTDSLRLEWRIGAGTSFAPFAPGVPQPGIPSAAPWGTGLDGDSQVTVSGLVLGQYDSVELRAVAVGTGGETPGAGTLRSPQDLLPGVPGEPSFSSIGATEVEVLSPALPTQTTSMLLQGRLLSDADSPWIGVQQNVLGGPKNACF